MKTRCLQLGKTEIPLTWSRSEPMNSCRGRNLRLTDLTNCGLLLPLPPGEGRGEGSFRSIPTKATRWLAFTLIELLVVIAIISVLAAMIFPVTRAVNRNKIKRRATGELAQVQAAIQSYKDKVGHYPPDSPPNGTIWTPWINQLYYELKGTTFSNGVYVTLDGTARVTSTAIPTIFGPTVTGFINCSRGGGDEARSAQNLIPDIRPSGFLMATTPGGPAFVLGTAIEGPLMLAGVNGGRINPWRYNSTSPTNNPSSFDLWLDVFMDGKTNRISNWSSQPIMVYTNLW